MRGTVRAILRFLLFNYEEICLFYSDFLARTTNGCKKNYSITIKENRADKLFYALKEILNSQMTKFMVLIKPYLPCSLY